MGHSVRLCALGSGQVRFILAQAASPLSIYHLLNKHASIVQERSLWYKRGRLTRMECVQCRLLRTCQ
jgi:hypothetical protein